MDNSKSIDALNTLVIINNDRIEGYKTAGDETEQSDLKAMFGNFGQTSQTCKAELLREIARLGGTPDEGTRTTGKFFRAWMEVKAALTGNDRKYILNSCEYGEDVAFEAYQIVRNDHPENLTAEQHKMLSAQQIMLKSDHITVKNLIEVLV